MFIKNKVFSLINPQPLRLKQDCLNLLPDEMTEEVSSPNKWDGKSRYSKNFKVESGLFEVKEINFLVNQQSTKSSNTPLSSSSFLIELLSQSFLDSISDSLNWREKDFLLASNLVKILEGQHFAVVSSLGYAQLENCKATKLEEHIR